MNVEIFSKNGVETVYRYVKNKHAICRAEDLNKSSIELQYHGFQQIITPITSESNA